MKKEEIGTILLIEAENGNVDAMVDWATWRSVYNSDTPLTQEEKDRVISYYMAGVDNDITTAYLNLGAMYYMGEYVKQDYTMAVSLYERAAAKGETQALCNLGYCYYYGRHSNIDYEKAYMYFTQSALLGNNCNAFYKLGDMYMEGLYVAKNQDFAFKLYEKALELAEVDIDDPNFLQADILMRLSECYLYGRGCEADAIEALHYATQSEYYFYKKIKANLDFSNSHFTRLARIKEEAKDMIRFDLELKDGVM